MIKPTICLQDLREKIGSRAKSSPKHRFWGMFVHIQKLETLEASYLAAKRNRGAPGVDGVTFEQIENAGRAKFLGRLSSDLEMGSYAPQGYRRKEIPKAGGKVRVISIPTIRDRVVQGAMLLILDPIFEVDFSDSSYGARPSRSAHQAIAKVKQGLLAGRHRVLDVDLSQYFDNIRHDRVLAKVAGRVQDRQVLAMVKQFLKRSGGRGIPQGSPLSPLFANLALNDLDHALDRGADTISYVRYLDDMVVLAPDSERGRRFADRALMRIREEAEAIGVSINEDKTKVVSFGVPGASFAFLGFVFHWRRSARTGGWYASMVPAPAKVTDVLRRVRDMLRHIRHLRMRAAVRHVNEIVRGWVNYFRVGNSADALLKVKNEVERKVRRFAARKSKRPGFGWKRWSRQVVYGDWGLFDEYLVRYLNVPKVDLQAKRIINPTR